MINQPAFSPLYRVEIQDERVLFHSHDGYTVFEGALCIALAELLDGTKSSDHIVQSLSHRFPAEELYFAIMLLEKDGYLVDAAVRTQDIAFWQSMRIDYNQVRKNLTSRNLSIISLDTSYDSIIEDHLRDLHVQIAKNASHCLILTSDYMHPELRTINSDAFKKDLPYLLINPTGPEIWIGPSVVPGASSCWACLKHRLDLNNPSYTFLSEKKGQHLNGHSLLMPKVVRQIGHSLAAIETAKWLASSEEDKLQNSIVTFDLKTLETKQHIIVWRPQCPACGNESKISVQIPEIKSRIGSKNNNYRICPPQETLNRFEHHISPITGVVRSLRRIDNPETIEFAHNYTANHSARLKGHSMESLRLATRDRSGGKGKYDIEARTSGLCEALERFSSIYDNDPIQCHDSYLNLRSKAIHPNDLMLFSDVQYRHRDAWNDKQSGGFQYVPEIFDEKVDIDWVEAHSISGDQTRFIPASFCYFGFDGAGTAYCKADSNGLAAGNCIEEAILQGLLELIERDAVAIWWYNKIRHPSVDLISFEERYFTRIIDHYATLDRDLWVLDITHDLCVPSFVAISAKRHARTEDILLGFGTHFDAKLAITRALLEVNQLLPTILRSNEERKSQLLPDFSDALDWWDSATTEKYRYLVPVGSLAPRSPADYKTFDEVNLAEMITQIVLDLRKKGLESYFYDMTRPDIGISVAKVIVPGLRHFWRRQAPGRLYEVPIKMGWLNEATKESNLNPVSLFL